MAAAGLADVRWILTAGGIIAIHAGTKPASRATRPGPARGGADRGRLEPVAQLERTEERLAEVAGGHGAELGRHAGGTLSAGGKRLRPVLVFLCAAEPDERLAAGAAVELLHMATLVHDDVLDGAELAAAARRSSPTAVRAATATGDLLFSRAFAELAATGSEAAARSRLRPPALARGELMQRADAFSDDPPGHLALPADYSLFEAYAGSARCSAPPEQAGSLGSFGDRLGVAFQMLDDVLDVADLRAHGQAEGADLLDGTVTLPLILARRSDPSLSGQ